MIVKIYGFNKHSSLHSVVRNSDNKVSNVTVFNEKQIRMDVTLISHSLFKGTLPTFIRRDDGKQWTAQDCWYPTWDENWAFPEYKSEAIWYANETYLELFFWEIMLEHSGKMNSTRWYKQYVPSTAFSETSNTYLTVARIFLQIKKFLKENKYVWNFWFGTNFTNV
jgi:hypothetical protein